MSRKLNRRLLREMFNKREYMEEYVVSLGTFIHPAPKYFYIEGYKRCKKISAREIFIIENKPSWALIETVEDISLFLKILNAKPESDFIIPQLKKWAVGDYVITHIPNPSRLKIVYRVRKPIMLIFGIRSREQLADMDLLIRDKNFPPLLKIINDEVGSRLYY